MSISLPARHYMALIQKMLEKNSEKGVFIEGDACATIAKAIADMEQELVRLTADKT
jgi:hypothetical protein